MGAICGDGLVELHNSGGGLPTYPPTPPVQDIGDGLETGAPSRGAGPHAQIAANRTAKAIRLPWIRLMTVA